LLTSPSSVGSSRSGQDGAAGYIQGDPADPRGVIRGQEQGGVGHVIRRPQALDRMGMSQLVLDGFRYLLLIALGQDRMPPVPRPIGLHPASAARFVSRAFDEALSEAGGSLPVWLVLLNLKIRRPSNQRELAEAVGVRQATLTHHLNAMDSDGLITRRRDVTNRRVHVVEITDAGEETFLRLRAAALAFDRRPIPDLQGHKG
jgi:MarR family transcriptional regulator for hemolysin